MVGIYDCLGLIGVLLIVYCYARLQWRRDFAKQLQYSICNFSGSVLVAISLTDKWNLSAFAVNVLMAGISAYGILRCIRYELRKSRPKKPSFAMRAYNVFSRPLLFL